MNTKVFPANAGAEVVRRAKVYADQTGVSEVNAMKHILSGSENAELVDEYNHGPRTREQRESDFINEKVLARMEKHGGDYTENYRAVAKELSARGLRESGIEAAEELKKCATAWTEKYDGDSERGWRVAHEWNPQLSLQATYAESGPAATQQIGALLAGLGKNQNRAFDADEAVQLVSEYLEIAQQAAGEFFDNQARVWINSNGLPDFTSTHMSTALRQVMRENPNAAALYNSGIVSVEALREIFAGTGFRFE